MSQDTATTTASPLMVCYIASSITTTVTMAPSGPTSSFGLLECGSAITADATGHKGCSWPHHCAASTALVPDAFSGICLLCHGSSTHKFFFQHELPTDLSIYIGVCYGVCFLFSGSAVDVIFTCGSSTTGVCITTSLQIIPMAGIYVPR